VERHGSRLLRFGLVGVSGVIVDVGLLYLLVAGLGMHKVLAAAIAAELSILSNFALNDRWTFRDRRPSSSWIRRAMQYNACTLLGEVLALPLMAALMHGLGMHYMAANLFAMSLAASSNYLLNSRFTWGCCGQAQPAPVPVPVHADW